MKKYRLIDNFKQLYGLTFGKLVLEKIISLDYQAWDFIRWFWFSYDFEIKPPVKQSSSFYQQALGLTYLWIVGEVVAGIYVIYLGATSKFVGGVPIGLAIILAYPIVIAHVMVLIRFLYEVIWDVINPKKAAKNLLCWVLEYQVKKLRSTHKFKVIAVAGSVGKTSTKLAIAKVLATSGKVLYQAGNYNDRLTVPLVIFNQTLPHLLNGFAWLKIIISNQLKISRAYNYQYVVVELGTDGPGQIAKFAYLNPELSVVTAVAMEHMEYFASLNAVADEELAVFNFSQKVLVNIEDIDAKYLEARQYISYGLRAGAENRITSTINFELKPTTLDFQLGPNHQLVEAEIATVGKQGAMTVLAAASVAALFEYQSETIKQGLESIEPFAGRMQILAGIQGSTIIDDTYNASPKAVQAALEVLYAAQAPQRIAILGDMNELGGFSAQAHKLIGEACDPKKLDLVITIGKQSAKYLAKSAEVQGCNVKSFDSPYAAGKYVREVLEPKAMILAKGSQNGVFAEEAVKFLLASPDDFTKLVRQSRIWMSTKRQQFADAPKV
jgi:UDP-N-acetylmuramoyl-tripeptide--D-alanyl-D-alanine ligase